MESGFYVAYAGLSARMQALDLLASNLANASTSGFKGQSAFYLTLLGTQAEQADSVLDVSVNKFGMLGGSKMDLRSGSLETTGNNTDLAMEGAGFFTIQTPQGIRYTRNGSFRLTAARMVVTQDGNPVMAEQGPLRVPVTLPAGEPTISPDGTVSVGGALVAKLHLVQFAPETTLTPEGNSIYVAPDGAEKPPTESSVRQGMLESSNINPIEGAVSLIVLQRQADLLGRALTIFSTDFDRAAAQDIPHVS